MRSKKFCFGMLVITLVFGMMIIGCKEDTQKVDSALNGTWVSSQETLVLDKGNFNVSYDSVPFARGTYTTSNGKITITLTHLYGDLLGLGSSWFTKEQLRQRGEFEEDLEMFEPFDASYSVSGNTLTVHWPDGPIVYTKR